MKLLPKWIMQDTHPAIYDAESVTAIEGVAKLHAAMQTMIKEYNTLVDDINRQFEQIVSSYEGDQKEYETAMRQEFQDFIDTVNLKMQHLDEVTIADLEKMIKELSEQATNILTYDSLDAVPADLPEGSFVAVPGEVLPVVELEATASTEGATLSESDVAKITALNGEIGVFKFGVIDVSDEGTFVIPITAIPVLVKAPTDYIVYTIPYLATTVMISNQTGTWIIVLV